MAQRRWIGRIRMKSVFLLLVASISVLAISCTVAAEPVPTSDNQSQVQPTSTSAPVEPTAEVMPPTPTTVPPVIVGAPEPAPTKEPTVRTIIVVATPTAAPAPIPTSTSRPQPTSTPQPLPTPTLTPTQPGPVATPTPLWDSRSEIAIRPTPTNTPIASPTPTAIVPPTVVAAPVEQQFEPLLNYGYSLLDGWTETRTDSSIVIYDSSLKISITISEQIEERWRYPTVGALGAQNSPVGPVGWETWEADSERWLGLEGKYEFIYIGTKHEIEYVNVIHWFLWGEVRVQVSADIPLEDWEQEEPRLRTDLEQFLDSFQPHVGPNFFDENDVLAMLATRFDDRKSGIFGRDEVARARVELSCQQIYTDFMEQPVYLGDGVWLARAETLEGIEFWELYEPTGEIQASQSNKSVC